jgi:hypothetical protein
MLVDATGTNSASNVAGAIRQAARLTGTSFDYLLATAQVESGLNPQAQAATSSARGLFQFIEQTWLATLKTAGPNLGYGRYADAIVRTDSGRYTVNDPVLRDQILKLRQDPTANAVMAGAFTQHNAAALAERLGRRASDGELYMAHFLGPGGAAQLIARAGDRPDARAADLFPRAARANRSIFYDNQGRTRSVAQVYRALAGRYEVARAGQPGSVAGGADKLGPATRRMARIDSPNLAGAFATNSQPAPVRSVNDGPVFHSLFQTGERREPVAPAISELWNTSSSVGLAAPIVPTTGVPGRPLDLFQTARPDVRSLFGTKS